MKVYSEAGNYSSPFKSRDGQTIPLQNCQGLEGSSIIILNSFKYQYCKVNRSYQTFQPQKLSNLEFGKKTGNNHEIGVHVSHLEVCITQTTSINQ